MKTFNLVCFCFGTFREEMRNHGQHSFDLQVKGNFLTQFFVFYVLNVHLTSVSYIYHLKIWPPLTYNSA